MLNGMERTLEKQLPERYRRWPEKKGVQEDMAPYENTVSDSDLAPWNPEQPGFPDPLPEP